MAQQYFVMDKIAKGQKGVRITGQFIVDGEVEVPPTGGGGGGGGGGGNRPRPVIPPIKIGGLKWILPPQIGDRTHYNASKAFAESMGYETVEHDDLSYPER